MDRLAPDLQGSSCNWCDGNQAQELMYCCSIFGLGILSPRIQDGRCLGARVPPSQRDSRGENTVARKELQLDETAQIDGIMEDVMRKSAS